ncbi:MAG: single-stranded-DNA-specific exonuclease RecJ [Phycisphaerales bacterium]
MSDPLPTTSSSSPVYRAGPLPTPTAHTPIRGLTRRWILREGAAATDHALSLLERILHARGTHDPAQVLAFLNPKLTHLHDPRLLPDIDLAAHRILAALHARERVVIYGDYDVDGVTATAILVHILHHLAPESVVATYIPHRDEGYGLSVAALQQLASEGANVVVSVDCGVTAVEPAAAAKAAGIDLIITDHHNPPAAGSPWPNALAIVHPRGKNSLYPFEHLSGAGVAYKLAWRIATLAAEAQGRTRVDEPTAALLVELLPLVALGAIADVVPLTGENRILARFGLERTKHSTIVGLRALVEACRLAGEKVSTWDVGFRLAPRLNASGRMAHAALALELFTTTDAARAAAIAEQLEARNQERRALEQTITNHAAERAVAEGQTSPTHRAIVLADPTWHRGVVGIVCSRLVDRFGRPTILLAEEDGVCYGSARSIEGFNLHAAIGLCAQHVESFGGHDMAAGVKVLPAKLPAFVAAFTAVCNERISIDDLTRRVVIDALCTGDELTLETVRSLEKLEPCGSGNPAVHLMLARVRIEKPPTPMGKGGEHLAIEVRSGSRVLRLVGWRMGLHRPLLRPGQTLDVVVRPGVSTWTGKPVVEPELIDLRIL